MAAAINLVPVPKPVRCAIYTRKSTDEGLNSNFNSLDAQREAAEAYIRSQRSDGWTLVPTQYSDGGYTGANIERPGVRKLLADIEAGEIDCVVVYKVDRLSRSLIDFAKMMGLFEQHGVCFVSVTQQFNTNTPLGRLTLNILLSFAQFEREIISDRTRDKQIAARRRGKWTGGHILLGYDLEPGGGKLVINPEEAERVREMFRLYTEGTSVQEIVQRLDKLDWRNKQWTTQDGKPYGGSPLRRCHIYKLLANVFYTGQVKAGEDVVPGEHEAIIDRRTFELARERLKENTCKAGNPHRVKHDSLLRGMLYCSCCGSGMYSTYSASGQKRYRYYICYRSQQKLEGYCTSRSVSAPVVEAAVVESIRRVGVHPEVLAETARVARQRLADALAELREELNTVNGRVKNLKSQLARLRRADPARLAEIREQVAVGESRTEGLRTEIVRREKHRIDEKDSRLQPLLFVISTEGDSNEGVFPEQVDYAKAILQGQHEDDSYFGIVYTIDKEDGWMEPESWRKANPNLGVSVFEEDLEIRCKQAIANADSQASFLTKRLNVRVGAASAYFNLLAWSTLCQDEDLRIEDFHGLPCIITLDLASKRDLTAKMIVFQRGSEYYVFGKYYLPGEAIEPGEPNYDFYRGWARDGWLTLTEGNITDYEYLERDLLADVSVLRPRQVGVDPNYNAGQFTTRMLAAGVPMVDVPHNVLNFSEPMKQLDALVVAGRVHHSGDPVLAWAMGNVVAKKDAKDNVYPRKARDENKIDPAVALVANMSLQARGAGEPEWSYEIVAI